MPTIAANAATDPPIPPPIAAAELDGSELQRMINESFVFKSLFSLL